MADLTIPSFSVVIFRLCLKNKLDVKTNPDQKHAENFVNLNI